MDYGLRVRRDRCGSLRHGSVKPAYLPRSVGDKPRIGDLTEKSRIAAGAYRECADPPLFSQNLTRDQYSRIAEFQCSCWEIIRMNVIFTRTPASRAGDQRPIGRFALNSHPPATVLMENIDCDNHETWEPHPFDLCQTVAERRGAIF